MGAELDIIKNISEDNNFMGEKIYTELEQKILLNAGVELTYNKEKLLKEKSELEQKINIKSSLGAIKLNTTPTDAKILVQNLKTHLPQCLSDNIFNNNLYKSCTENLLTKVA